MLNFLRPPQQNIENLRVVGDIPIYAGQGKNALELFLKGFEAQTNFAPRGDRIRSLQDELNNPFDRTPLLYIQPEAMPSSIPEYRKVLVGAMDSIVDDEVALTGGNYMQGVRAHMRQAFRSIDDGYASRIEGESPKVFKQWQDLNLLRNTSNFDPWMIEANSLPNFVSDGIASVSFARMERDGVNDRDYMQRRYIQMGEETIDDTEVAQRHVQRLRDDITNISNGITQGAINPESVLTRAPHKAHVIGAKDKSGASFYYPGGFDAGDGIPSNLNHVIGYAAGILSGIDSERFPLKNLTRAFYERYIDSIATQGLEAKFLTLGNFTFEDGEGRTCYLKDVLAEVSINPELRFNVLGLIHDMQNLMTQWDNMFLNREVFAEARSEAIVLLIGDQANLSVQGSSVLQESVGTALARWETPLNEDEVLTDTSDSTAKMLQLLVAEASENFPELDASKVLEFAEGIRDDDRWASIQAQISKGIAKMRPSTAAKIADTAEDLVLSIAGQVLPANSRARNELAKPREKINWRVLYRDVVGVLHPDVTNDEALKRSQVEAYERVVTAKKILEKAGRYVKKD